MKLIKENIDKQFALTGPVQGYDLYRIKHMREKWKDIMNNHPSRFQNWMNTSSEWEKELMLNGILPDEIIDMNKNRFGFRRDRSYTDENGEIVEDVWFSTFMLCFSKIVEEETTLLFLNKNYNYGVWWLEENPKAAKIDSENYITCDPDFIIKSSIDNREIYVEQKCVYKKDWKMSIRSTQYNLFNKMIEEGKKVYILMKTSLEDKDIYEFYNFERIRDLLDDTYKVTKETLEQNNIRPILKNVDIHCKYFEN